MDEAPVTVIYGRAAGRGLVLAAAPFAAAIGIFGIVFGAAALPEMDAAMVLGMTLLVFSGTLQFATIGLLASGAGPLPILLTALALNMRHVVLGAVLRPHIEGSPVRRALMAWFMIDESFGLALAAKNRASFVLVLGGVMFYLAWVIGTVLGIVGARVVAIEGLAAAIFPVLFVGLTALTIRSRGDAVRAVIAGALVAAMSFVPAIYPFAPIVAALAVALPAARRA